LGKAFWFFWKNTINVRTGFYSEIKKLAMATLCIVVVFNGLERNYNYLS